jgi:enterochelin esterase family protein
MHKHGRIEILQHQSLLLADNPLGDPSVRDVAVYVPPAYDAQPQRRFPTIVLLAGFSGSGLQLLNRAPWMPSLPERFDAAIAAGRAAEAIVVLPDCFTRYGGSQYVDSPAIGRYASYLVDEVVPLVDEKLRTIPKREARAVLGKSSGGYGAWALAMWRPDTFGALGSHAGDSAFELSYLRDFGHAAMILEKKGGVRGFLSWFEELPAKPGGLFDTLMLLCCSAAWSPSPTGPYGFGEGFDLPFHPLTGALRDDVWSRWLERDPVRMLDKRLVLDAARSMRAIFLDAGLADEYNLQLGTRQICSKLARADVRYVHEEFDGGHMNTPFRYARSYEVLSKALASD